MSKPRIAFIGLGAMGARMASNLLDAGYRLVVWNRSPARAQPLAARGAKVADTPAQAAAEADIVMTMLTDDAASEAVWTAPETGILAGLRAGTPCVASSTLTPAWVRRLSERVAAAGGVFMDAPVAGTRPQAEAGSLIYMVGGPSEGLERVRAALEATGSAVKHVGPVGAGATLKLAVNALFGIQVAALSELLGMLERGGFERGPILEALGGMPITSPALQGVGKLIAARQYAPMFPIDLVEKDLGYAVDTARALGSSAPIAEATRAVFGRAQEAGYGGDNIAGVAQLYDTY